MENFILCTVASSLFISSSVMLSFAVYVVLSLVFKYILLSYFPVREYVNEQPLFSTILFTISLDMINFITPVLSKSFTSTILRKLLSFHFVISRLTFEREPRIFIIWFNAISFIIVVLSAYCNCNVLSSKSSFLFFHSCDH